MRLGEYWALSSFLYKCLYEIMQNFTNEWDKYTVQLHWQATVSSQKSHHINTHHIINYTFNICLLNSNVTVDIYYHNRVICLDDDDNCFAI